MRKRVPHRRKRTEPQPILPTPLSPDFSLVQAHLPYARKWGRWYHLKYGLDRDDLTSAAIDGLIEASRRFDPNRGYAFATYAKWWVQQRLQYHVFRERNWAPHVPLHQVFALSGTVRSFWQLFMELGRTPTSDEIARRLDVPYQKQSQLIAWATSRTISLSIPIGEGGMTLGDVLKDEATDPTAHITGNLLNISCDVRFLLTTLPKIERKVIEMRFGFKGTPRTLRQIAVKIGYSVEGVRLIEARAITHLAARSEKGFWRGTNHR